MNAENHAVLETSLIRTRSLGSSTVLGWVSSAVRKIKGPWWPLFRWQSFDWPANESARVPKNPEFVERPPSRNLTWLPSPARASYLPQTPTVAANCQVNPIPDALYSSARCVRPCWRGPACAPRARSPAREMARCKLLRYVRCCGAGVAVPEVLQRLRAAVHLLTLTAPQSTTTTFPAARCHCARPLASLVDMCLNILFCAAQQS